LTCFYGQQEDAVSGKDVKALHAKIYQLESEMSTLGGDKKGVEQLLETTNRELEDKKEEAAMLRRSLASMENTTAHLHQLLRESQVRLLYFIPPRLLRQPRLHLCKKASRSFRC
jgi:chromosome segregation ATPase